MSRDEDGPAQKLEREKELAKAFGKRLFALRDAAGESQEDLAREVGVSVGSVSRWERGVDSPRADKVALLAEHYETSADHLLLGIPHSPRPPDDAFHDFMARPTGVFAQEHGLVRTLLAIVAAYPKPPTVRTYEVLTTVLLQDAMGEPDVGDGKKKK